MTFWLIILFLFFENVHFINRQVVLVSSSWFCLKTFLIKHFFCICDILMGQDNHFDCSKVCDESTFYSLHCTWVSVHKGLDLVLFRPLEANPGNKWKIRNLNYITNESWLSKDICLGRELGIHLPVGWKNYA